jgi:CubicO group peptidase (beta-lactamase class C family)
VSALTTSVDELLGAARADVDSGAVPAGQVAVARGGEIVAFETFGDATATTRFCIFSATKPIVASAIWLLIADGLIDGSRPVCEYVPEFGRNGKECVTVEQVLLHTSGFPNAVMSDDDGTDATRRRARFAQWRLEWEPGTRFEYHPSAAHWVLADLIERASGDDFRDFIERRVCAPLGLPRVLGLPPDAQSDIAPLVAVGGDPMPDPVWFRLNEPPARVAGNPGGGAIMTAADLARFYQALLHNPHGLWDAAVLHDAETNIRCTFTDPLMGVPVNRTIGLVVAGDDGQHILRYAIFGSGNSPRSFGHAGAHAQVGWADPETGISFSYVNNAVTSDMMASGIRANRLATIAAALEL